MNADMNTLMALMSMLGGKGQGGNQMQTLLPLLMNMMSARGGSGTSQSTDGAGAAQNLNTARGGNAAQGAGGQNPFGMLPFLMNMMTGTAHSSAPDGETPRPEQSGAAENGRTRSYGAEHRRGDAERTQNGRSYAERRYAETPFCEIGFAGAEVRSFMETLWRVRRRI